MKVLIAYATKTGTAKKCAEMLADKLDGCETEIKDLRFESPKLSDYDFAVIGGSIRVGMLNKYVKNFFRTSFSSLDGVRYGLFVTCASVNEDEVKQFFSANLNADLLSGAEFALSFGGELIPDNQKGLDKYIIASMAKDASRPQPHILEENLCLAASLIKKEDDINAEKSNN